MTDRKSAFELTANEQNLFLQVITTMNSGPVPTPYAQFVGIHADMRHRMHTRMGDAVGRQRFLPWHRDFLLKFEAAMPAEEVAQTARAMDAELGINHSYLFIELHYADVIANWDGKQVPAERSIRAARKNSGRKMDGTAHAD